MVKNTAVKLMGLLMLGVVLNAHALSDKNRDAIAERIKPVGEVCLEGDSSCGAAASASADGAARSGQDIYNATCTACHSTGAGGAPKVGDVAAWTPRLSKDIEQVYANALGGLNGMPAKGLCMDCSDDEIKAAVDHMVSNSK